MSFAAWAIQKAVATRLSGHASTSGYAVTDNDASDLPYIKLGETTESEFSTTSTEGSEHTLLAHFWAERTDQLMQMMEAYDEAIRDGVMDLSADGFAQIGPPNRDLSETLHDFDEALGQEIRHGVMRHRFFIQQTS